MTVEAQVVKTERKVAPLKAEQPLLDVRDTSNKADPTPINALVMQKHVQAPMGGDSVMVETHTPAKPVPLTPPAMVGPVPANEVGMHSLMKKDFHSFLAKLQMLSHTEKERLVECAKYMENYL